MTDTIRELILRILDYVERTPGAHFDIARWREKVVKPDGNQMYFHFHVWDNEDVINYISRGDNDSWSAVRDLTEDNLRYLVEQLEGME